MIAPELTPESVLVCDLCHGPIEDVHLGLFGWSTHLEDREAVPGSAARDDDDDVTFLVLAHKHHETFDPSLWAELDWLADPSAALGRLAQLSRDYRWTGEHWARLVRIAWAVVAVTPASVKTRSRDTARRLGFG